VRLGPIKMRRAILEIALHAVEIAFDVRRDLSPHLAIVDIGLEARRRIEPRRRKHRVTAKIHCQISPHGLEAPFAIFSNRNGS